VPAREARGGGGPARGGGGGLFDVRSGAPGSAADGTAFSDL
jgi:hypothetical protein